MYNEMPVFMVIEPMSDLEGIVASDATFFNYPFDMTKSIMMVGRTFQNVLQVSYIPHSRLVPIPCPAAIPPHATLYTTPCPAIYNPMPRYLPPHAPLSTTPCPAGYHPMPRCLPPHAPLATTPYTHVALGGGCSLRSRR